MAGIGNTLGAIAPLVSMIPGIGTVAGTAMGVAGAGISAIEANKEKNDLEKKAKESTALANSQNVPMQQTMQTGQQPGSLTDAMRSATGTGVPQQNNMLGATPGADMAGMRPMPPGPNNEMKSGLPNNYSQLSSNFTSPPPGTMPQAPAPMGAPQAVTPNGQNPGIPQMQMANQPSAPVTTQINQGQPVQGLPQAGQSWPAQGGTNGAPMAPMPQQAPNSYDPNQSAYSNLTGQNPSWQQTGGQAPPVQMAPPGQQSNYPVAGGSNYNPNAAGNPTTPPTAGTPSPFDKYKEWSDGISALDQGLNGLTGIWNATRQYKDAPDPDSVKSTKVDLRTGAQRAALEADRNRSTAGAMYDMNNKGLNYSGGNSIFASKMNQGLKDAAYIEGEENKEGLQNAALETEDDRINTGQRNETALYNDQANRQFNADKTQFLTNSLTNIGGIENTRMNNHLGVDIRNMQYGNMPNSGNQTKSPYKIKKISNRTK